MIPIADIRPGLPVSINTLNGREGVIEAVIVLVRTQEGTGEYRAFVDELDMVAAAPAKPPPSRHAARDAGYTDQECGKCGAMKMRRTGVCLTCDNCGDTSGGCS